MTLLSLTVVTARALALARKKTAFLMVFFFNFLMMFVVFFFNFLIMFVVLFFSFLMLSKHLKGQL